MYLWRNLKKKNSIIIITWISEIGIGLYFWFLEYGADASIDWQISTKIKKKISTPTHLNKELLKSTQKTIIIKKDKYIYAYD